jgi:hypothetical protein
MLKMSCVIAAVIALAFAAAATAAEPSVVVTKVDRTSVVPAGGVCDFALTIHTEGTRRVTTFYDSNGNVVRTMIVLSDFSITYSNAANGKSIRTVLAGPLIVEPRPDGTVLVTIPGNDGLLVLPGEGQIYSDAGRIVYIAPSLAQRGVRLEVLQVAGGYRDESDDFVAGVCGALT